MTAPSLDRSVAEALALALGDFLGQRIDRDALSLRLRGILGRLDAAADAPPAPAVARETLRNDDETRRAALDRNLDTRVVGRIFSEERSATKRGKYALRFSDHDSADAALRWAMAENADDPAAAVRESVRGYFVLGGEWERTAGFPFKGWASDPGRWLSEWRNRSTHEARTNAPATRPSEDVTPPEEAKAHVAEIIRKLSGGIGV